ncbi:hypothetical protein HID58_082123 [Brassica napus]|uniref:Uncharacterized protein n=1 Tax=Brassica napus TaxID=3708 RepID=A0ABQ7YBB3_BRANA|nr:hypothetical protein HID58_082123 [Brassica napus]
MKVELEEFRAEATHLKNHQSTIRRLEERNRQLEQLKNTKEVVEIKQRNQNTLDLFKDREQALQGTSTVRLSYKQLMKILRTRIGELESLHRFALEFAGGHHVDLRLPRAAFF